MDKTDVGYVLKTEVNYVLNVSICKCFIHKVTFGAMVIHRPGTGAPRNVSLGSRLCKINVVTDDRRNLFRQAGRASGHASANRIFDLHRIPPTKRLIPVTTSYK